jgi:hypothetical protein
MVTEKRSRALGRFLGAARADESFDGKRFAFLIEHARRKASARLVEQRESAGAIARAQHVARAQ